MYSLGYLDAIASRSFRRTTWSRKNVNESLVYRLRCAEPLFPPFFTLPWPPSLSLSRLYLFGMKRKKRSSRLRGITCTPSITNEFTLRGFLFFSIFNHTYMWRRIKTLVHTRAHSTIENLTVFLFLSVSTFSFFTRPMCTLFFLAFLFSNFTTTSPSTRIYDWLNLEQNPHEFLHHLVIFVFFFHGKSPFPGRFWI